MACPVVSSGMGLLVLCTGGRVGSIAMNRRPICPEYLLEHGGVGLDGPPEALSVLGLLSPLQPEQPALVAFEAVE